MSFEKAFQQIFKELFTTQKKFQLHWKDGTQEVIEGETLPKAWNAKGWSKAKIQELASYTELK